MSSVMESVCEYISECPHIDPELPLFLDYVSDKDCYCVTTIPNIPCTKDVIGNKTYTVTFQFALRAAISNDVERCRNMEFLEGFCKWIEEQNERCSFPALAANEEGKSIKVVESAALDEVSDDRVTGVYVAQLELKYKQYKHKTMKG